MLSRVADSLYWMSRYLERAEHAARVGNVHLNLMLDATGDSLENRWPRIASVLMLPGEPAVADSSPEKMALLFEQIADCIAQARENARQVREQISSEMWEHLNRLFLEQKQAGAANAWEAQPLEFLGGVKEGLHLFHGVTDSTMSHGQGWQFIQVGRYLERAAATGRLLDAHCREFRALPDQAVDSNIHMEWVGLLRSCTAFEAYCKVYTADLKAERIAEFLLFNPEFPHSIRFAVERMQESLEAIGEDVSAKKSAQVVRLAGRLRASLSFTPLEEVMSGVHAFLENVARQCTQIHTAIHQVYINYPIEAALGA